MLETRVVCTSELSIVRLTVRLTSNPPTFFSPCSPFLFARLQGAFYILGVDIVNYLNRSKDVLSVMSVEDAMMGLWLLGVDKVKKE